MTLAFRAREAAAWSGAELVRGGRVEQPREGQQAQREQQWLRRRVQQRGAAHRQKNFFRSMPAYSEPTCGS